MPKTARTCVLVLLIAALTAASSPAQTPTTPTTPATPPTDTTTDTVTAPTATTTQTEQTFELTQVVPSGSTGVTAFTVPAGSALIVTDVILTNTGTTASCGAAIARGGAATTGTSVTGVLCVPATTSIELPLLTGIDFAGGQTVQLLNAAPDGGAAPASAISFHLRGILATGTIATR